MAVVTRLTMMVLSALHLIVGMYTWDLALQQNLELVPDPDLGIVSLLTLVSTRFLGLGLVLRRDLVMCPILTVTGSH